MKKVMMMITLIFSMFLIMSCDTESVTAPTIIYGDDTIEVIEDSIYAEAIAQDSVFVEVRLIGTAFDDPDDLDDVKIKSYLNGELLVFTEYDLYAESVSSLYSSDYKTDDSLITLHEYRNDTRGYYEYSFGKLAPTDIVQLDVEGSFYASKIYVYSLDYTDTLYAENYISDAEVDFKLNFSPILSDTIAVLLEYY